MMRAYIENSWYINALFCIFIWLWGSFFMVSILPKTVVFTWWIIPMVVTIVSVVTGFAVAIYFLLERIAHRMAAKP
jgi:uncharacterized membrane protein